MKKEFEIRKLRLLDKERERKGKSVFEWLAFQLGLQKERRKKEREKKRNW